MKNGINIELTPTQFDYLYEVIMMAYELEVTEQKGWDIQTYDFPDGKNDDRWYYWCIDNWGTKWELSELGIEYDDEVLELTFSTAWSPPEGVMQELKDRYPDLGFTCFYDEPGMEVAGYYQDSS